MKHTTYRRQFLKATAIAAVSPFVPAMVGATGRPAMVETMGPPAIVGATDRPGIGGSGALGANGGYPANDENIIGPKEGYSPQIGTLVSMMAWLRPQITRSVKGLTVEQLDFLLDDKANTIGALLYHLAATDAFYHEHTFKGVNWGSWDEMTKKKFGVAMELGDEGRKIIKGHNADFYLDLLKETRESTLAEFKKRDDAWFMSVDTKWGWGPTNNYCKWFHVCEHESHHLGQIAFLKSRLPGAKG